VSGVLDVFHAVPHIAETSRTLFGAGTDEATAWLDEGRMTLIRQGWGENSNFIEQTRKPVRSKRKLESIDRLKRCLLSHTNPLNDAD